MSAQASSKKSSSTNPQGNPKQLVANSRSTNKHISPQRNGAQLRETLVPVMDSLGHTFLQPMLQQFHQIQNTQVILKETVVRRERVDTTELEVRITQLTQEAYMWRKKYLDLQGSKDRSQGLEETIASLEGRIKVLVDENKKLHKLLKEKINENEKQRLKIQSQEVEIHQLNQYSYEVDRLHQLLQSRQAEVDDWRLRFSELEQSFLQFKSIEITLLEYEGKMKGLEQEVQMWREKYARMEQERDELRADLRKAQEALSKANLDTSQRGSMSRVKVLELENERLREQLKQLLLECDEWRKRALSLELQCFEFQNKLVDESNKNHLLEAEVERLNDNAAIKDQENSELRVDNQNLMGKMADVAQLQTQLHNLQEIINLKAQDNEKLAKANAKVSGEAQDLRHELIQKFELEHEHNFVLSELDRLTAALDDRSAEYNRLRQQYNGLEQQTSEQKHQLLVQDKEIQELLQYKSDLQMAEHHISFLETQNKDLREQINNLQQQIGEFLLQKRELIRLQHVLEARDREVEELRRKLTQLGLRGKELKILDERNLELEKQLTSLQNESQRTSKQLKEAETLQHNLQGENDQLHGVVNSRLLIERELTKLRTYRDSISAELAQWKAKYEAAQKDLVASKKERDQAIEGKNFREQETKQLTNLLEIRQHDLEEWRTKASKWEQENFATNKLYSELQLQYQQLESERANYLHKYEVAYNESELQRQQNDALKDQQASDLRAHRSEILSLEGELRQQVGRTEQKGKEAELWKQKYLKAEQELDDLQKVQTQLNDLQKHSQQLEQNWNRLNSEFATLQDNYQQQTQQLDQLKSDLQTLESVRELNTKLQVRLDKTTKDYLDAATKIPPLEQELSDLKAKQQVYLNKIDLLGADLERVNEVYQGKIKDNEGLRNRCNALEQSVINLGFLERRVAELEALVQRLRDVQTTLQQSHEDKSGQVEAHKQAVSGLEARLSSLAQTEAQVAKQQLWLDQARKDIESVKTLQQGAERALNDTKKIADQLRSKLGVAEIDLVQTKAKLDAKEAALNDAVTRYVKAENSLEDAKAQAAKVPELNQRVNLLSDENQRQQAALKETQENLKAVQIKAQQQEKVIATLEPITQDVFKLRDTVNADQEDLAKLRGDFTDASEARIRDSEELHAQVAKQQGELEQAEQKAALLPELETLLAQLESDVKVARQDAAQNLEENQRLKFEVMAAELTIAGYKQMETDFKTLRDDHMANLTTLDELRIKLSKQEQEINDLKNMREGLENRIVMLAGEIERLNAKNRKKNEENEDLHEQIKRLEQAVADLQPLEGDNRRLDEQLVTKNDEVELWKRRFEEQEDEANKAKSAREGLENRLALLSSEIERMNIKVRNYQKTIEDQTLRIQELEQENNELRKLESTIHELESKLDTTYQELDHLTADLNTKVENINNQNQRITQLESDLLNARGAETELHRLELEAQTHAKELDSWKAQVEALQKKIDELENIKYNYESNIAMMSSEIERLNKKYNQAQQDIPMYQGQIDQLHQELDRLEDQNRNLLSDFANQPAQSTQQQTTQQITQQTTQVIQSQQASQPAQPVVSAQSTTQRTTVTSTSVRRY